MINAIKDPKRNERMEFLMQMGYDESIARKIIRVTGRRQVVPAMKWLLAHRAFLISEGFSWLSAEAIMMSSLKATLSFDRPNTIVIAFKCYCDAFATILSMGVQQAANAIKGMFFIMSCGLPNPE